MGFLLNLENEGEGESGHSRLTEGFFSSPLPLLMVTKVLLEDFFIKCLDCLP